MYWALSNYTDFLTEPALNEPVAIGVGIEIEKNADTY